MEKGKNVQLAVIAVLAVAVLAMSVGYAAFSTRLNLNGTANVKASSWRSWKHGEYGPWIQPRLDFALCQLHELNNPLLFCGS